MVCVPGGISTPRPDSHNETNSISLMQDIEKILEGKGTPTKFEPTKGRNPSYRMTRIKNGNKDIVRGMQYYGTKDINETYLRLLGNLIDPKSPKDTFLVIPDSGQKGKLLIYIVPADMKSSEEVVSSTTSTVRGTLAA